MNKKIAVFGGTFDPIHKGHVRLAEWLHNELHIDLVYFVPAARHAFKINSKISPAEIRVELLAAAIKPFPYMKISRIELDRSAISYTVDTLEEFPKYEQLENFELYFVIGKDNLSDFHRWKNPERILKLAKLIVLKRSGLNGIAKFSESENKRIITVDSPCIDISSSEIRARIEHGRSYKNLVPAAVFEKIERYQLYS